MIGCIFPSVCGEEVKEEEEGARERIREIGYTEENRVGVW